MQRFGDVRLRQFMNLRFAAISYGRAFKSGYLSNVFNGLGLSAANDDGCPTW